MSVDNDKQNVVYLSNGIFCPPKKNAIWIYRIIWLDLENIAINLRNQLPKKKKRYFMTSFIGNIQNKKLFRDRI